MSKEGSAISFTQAEIASASGAGLTATGNYSVTALNLSRSQQSHVCIVPQGPVTSGTVTVRGRPTGRDGFVPCGIESINLASATTWSFIVPGFWDAWMLTVNALVDGLGVKISIAATQEMML